MFNVCYFLLPLQYMLKENIVLCAALHFIWRLWWRTIYALNEQEFPPLSGGSQSSMPFSAPRHSPLPLATLSITKESNPAAARGPPPLSFVDGHSGKSTEAAVEDNPVPPLLMVGSPVVCFFQISRCHTAKVLSLRTLTPPFWRSRV